VIGQLTFGDEVWLAVIQAVGVAVGVGAGILGGFVVASRQAGKTFEHQRTLAAQTWQAERADRQADRESQARLDRDRLLRSERIPLYRRLIEAAIEVLSESEEAFDALEGNDDESTPGLFEARPGHSYWPAYMTWRGVLTEARLLAARPVRDAALRVEQLRSNRIYYVMLKMHSPDLPLHVGGPEPGEEPEDFRDRMSAENKESIEALIKSCNEDIESLEPPAEKG